MATELAGLAGLAWLANLIMDIAAAGYCYRITRITGGFRAWWLMIAFATVFAISSFSSVSYSVLASETFSKAATPAITNVALFDIALGMLMSLLLLGSMAELFWVFQRQSKRTESPKVLLTR